jgi:hypothetical protein
LCKTAAAHIEPDVVMDHVIALATTAWLEALDLALIRWGVPLAPR